ncbi:hypothetical protein ACWDA9_41940, partial [Streptomyces sp. NPDC001193]
EPAAADRLREPPGRHPPRAFSPGSRAVLEELFPDASLAGPEDLRAKAVKDNTGGWPQVLDALKKRTEQSSA